MPETDLVLTEALGYAARGWRVVPLYGLRDGVCECRQGAACDSAGKHPRVNKWQKEATVEASGIESWWQKWPESNLGVALGQASGLIDLECDSPEAERVLLELFDGEFPVTPTFQSTRGKHRLFRWRTGFPLEATKRLGAIDVKLGSGDKGSQSVFPPSLRADGGRYTWLVGPDDAELAEIPDEVVKRMQRAWHGGKSLNGQSLTGLGENAEAAGEMRAPSKRLAIYDLTKKIAPGERNDVLYAEACEQWRMSLAANGTAALDEPERQASVFITMSSFNAHRCEQPLPEEEVLKLVESARKFHADRATGKAMAGLTQLGLQHRDGEWWPGLWRIEVVNSDPRIARLFAPFLPDGCIEMPMERFDSPIDVHRAVLCATGKICLDQSPGFWASIWNGKRGSKDRHKRSVALKAKLIEAADWIEAPAELKRNAVIAATILDSISGKPLEEGKEPYAAGHPQMLSDGRVVFRFDTVFAQLSSSVDKFTRHELSAVLKKAGTTDHIWRVRGRQTRFKVLSRRGLKALESMREHDEECA